MAKIDTRIIIFYTICIIIGSWSIVMYRGVDRSVDRGVVYYRGMVYRFVVDNRGMMDRFMMDNRGVVNRSMVNGSGVVDRGMVNWGVMDRSVVANGGNGTTGMVNGGVMDRGVVADGTKPAMGKGNNPVMAWAMISQCQTSQCDEDKNLEFINFLLSKLFFQTICACLILRFALITKTITYTYIFNPNFDGFPPRIYNPYRFLPTMSA